MQIPQGPTRCSVASPRPACRLAEVTTVLEDQGVASFSASFDDLLESLEAKAATLA